MPAARRPVRFGAALLAVGALPWTASSLKCGFTYGDRRPCSSCFEVALKTKKLSFWWNWGTDPSVDFDAEFPPGLEAEVRNKFIPMLWSQAPPVSYDFLGLYTHVMGYNEPDLYGPTCNARDNPPAWGCKHGESRPARTSGWAPLFDPSLKTEGQPHAALFWQWSVNNMTVRQGARPGGVQRIISPAMALDAEPRQSCIGVDPAWDGAPKECYGWLKVFKENARSLPCRDFRGKRTNCWDVIDAIQIHAYARSASEVKEKVRGYYEVFREDFEGLNGRTKKSLWLSEVAAATADEDLALSFMHELLNDQEGLGNWQYRHVERVSWFSASSFPSFQLPSYTPKEGEVWRSALFSDGGALTDLGRRFFSYCEEVTGTEASNRRPPRFV